MSKEEAVQAPAERAKAAAEAAAQPLTPYRVFWMFLIAGFAGDLIEVVFWLLTRGELISRSSLIYGPFSLVWGLAAVLLTLVCIQIFAECFDIPFTSYKYNTVLKSYSKSGLPLN